MPAKRKKDAATTVTKRAKFDKDGPADLQHAVLCVLSPGLQDNGDQRQNWERLVNSHFLSSPYRAPEVQGGHIADLAWNAKTIVPSATETHLRRIVDLFAEPRTQNVLTFADGHRAGILNLLEGVFYQEKGVASIIFSYEPSAMQIFFFNFNKTEL